MTRTPTIYVDVSETVVTRGNTGIQRVVRRIVGEGEAAAAAAGCRWVPVVATARGLRPLSDKGREALMRSDVSGLIPALAPLAPSGGRGPTRLIKSLLAAFPQVYEAMRLRRLDQAFAGLVEPASVQIRREDIYLMLDSFWLRSAAPRAAEKLRRRGRSVVAVIYDVLALTDPQYFAGDLPTVLARQFARLVKANVAFVSISAEAARQVHERAWATWPNGAGEVGHFPLGHDLEPSSKPAPDGGAVLLDGPLFLVVGTLEARKNHQVVLDAFERLWATGWPGTLLIIGKPGWGTDPLLARLAAHPERGRRLLVEHAASDERLADAYRSAAATIMPSLAEGFGLPIVESMAAGVPVIASDIAVFREILGNDPLLFDPANADDLVRAVNTLLADPAAHRTRAASFRWPDWRASADALVERVLALAS